MDKNELLRLRKMSAKARIEVLKMFEWRKYGHLGGSLSVIEVLSVLYNKHMRHDPKNQNWNERDYVVLSKGHSGPGLYATLAVQGYFDTSMLCTLNEGGANLPSHPDKNKTPGIDATTGSLGQGTSIAAGIGYGLHLEGSNQYVYLIVGDGELNEGQCWEAFQFIAHNKLNHVIVFIDENKKQLDGCTNDVMKPFDIVEKMRAFGFQTQKVKGNDEESISKAITMAKLVKNNAVCIVLDTIKGQGVPYFENMADNHSVKFKEKEYEETNRAIRELEKFVMDGGV